MQQHNILSQEQFQITIVRLCHQLIENHDDFSNAVLIGLQPRGIYLAHRIQQELQQILSTTNIFTGELDVTFHRDDLRKHADPIVPKSTQLDFIIEDKNVILIDDVLYTGRTIRAGLDAMLDFGRPKKVELMVLIDRRYSRDLPIQPDYVGKIVDTIASEKVKVEWKETEGEDKVCLYTPKEI